MKLKFNGFLALLLVLMAQVSFAQDITATGTVTDQTGLPMPGVNVLVKGTSTGVQTDFDGNFKIAAGQGQILVFSFLGMKTVQLPAAANMKVKLTDDSLQIEGVVVTALGIKRDKKSLGYSSQKLDAAAVNTAPTSNFLNNLSGKVAGLEVRNNSNFGGSTNIVLRGIKSVTGNNQALIVVDGVPLVNANLNSADAKNSRDGYDFGNSASDIDQNNIESINVLKGAAASALYGSDAANGAIMITTKKGKQRQALGISFSSSITTGTIDKETFVTYQKAYGGGGYDGHDNLLVTDVNGDGVDDLLVPTGYDISYGNAYDPNLQVYGWDSFVPGNANFGKTTAWQPAKNDPSKFFERSFGTLNTVNLSGGDEKSTYNFSYTNNQENGVLPNSRLLKNSLSGAFTRDFTDKLKFGTTVAYVDQRATGRNNVGYGNNFIGGFRQWWQTNVDIKELKQEYFRDHKNVTWNMNDPLNGDYSAAYWDNPYWDRYENYETDSRRRMTFGANVSYDITKGFNVLVRGTVDNSLDRQEQRLAVGSVPAEFGVSFPQETIGSGYELYTRSFTQQTYDLIATYDVNLSKSFGAKLLGGGTLKHSSVDSFDGSTTGGLVIPKLYNLSNSKTFVAPVETEFYVKKSGFYGQASLDFKKAIYLEGTFRQDKATSLPQANNVYNYYSVGSSIVLSEFFKANWLDLAKLRINYAEVGNDTDSGIIGQKSYVATIGSNPLYTNSATYFQFEKLKPELEKSWEFGVETILFHNRFNLDFSIYQSNTENQIFNVPQSAATGFTSSRINAGELENKGIEVAVNLVPLKTKNFKWDLGVNWSQNKNKLLSLDSGRKNLVLASFQSGITLNATVGEPYGTIKGSDYVLDPNGNKIVGDDGNYLSTDTNDHVIGNIQAKWTGGVTNKFTYKDVALSFLIDIKKGGSVFSLDQAYGQDTGLYPETAGYNDLGNPVRSAVVPGATPGTYAPNSGGYINQGVMLNPAWTATNGLQQYIPNVTRVSAEDSSEANGTGYGITANPDSAYVYDASYVKLREVALTYSLPAKFLEKSLIKDISFSLIGNNLWIIDKNLPYADPEAGTSAGNVQGYQSGVMPTVKTYAFNIKVNF